MQAYEYHTICIFFFKEDTIVALISVNNSPDGLGCANHSISLAHIQRLARDCILHSLTISSVTSTM